MRITRRMLELAESEAWEQVEELEQMRRHLLVNEIQPGWPITEIQEMQSYLNRIIELDSQVLLLARTRQAELGKLLGRLSHGRKAHRAYLDQTLSE